MKENKQKHWLKKKSESIAFGSHFFLWCPEGDSNSHAIQRYHLKIVCLPIPPSGHRCSSIEKAELWQVFFNMFFHFLASMAFFRPQHGSRRGDARHIDKDSLSEYVLSPELSSIWEPGGGCAANPARFERKQR